jgi:hypothetical protein
MDGVAALKALPTIRGRTPSLPVLTLTGDASDFSRDLLSRRGEHQHRQGRCRC